jgi:hypothetical protein
MTLGTLYHITTTPIDRKEVKAQPIEELELDKDTERAKRTIRETKEEMERARKVMRECGELLHECMGLLRECRGNK